MGKPLSFETKLLATIISTVLLVAVLAATTWLAVKNERNQARRLQHTMEILNSISQIKNNLLIPATIVRGYIISGNEQDLSTLEKHKVAREEALQRLSELTADNPVMAKEWLALNAAIDARKEIAERLIALRKTEGFDAARAYLVSENVGDQLKSLIQIFRSMEDEESRLLSVRHAELLRARSTSIAVGSVATAFLFMLLAITYLLIRRQMKTNLKTQHALELSSTRVATILNTVADGIITIDPHGVIETMNPAAEELFGYRASEVVGNNVKMLMPEPHRSAHDHHLARYLETGEKHIIGTGREAHGMRKDGSTFPVELSVSEMILDGEKHFTGVLHDISARKKNEQALIDARDEANRANQAKSEFLSNMSHELRTPLNAILGFSQLMEFDANLSLDHQDNVREILKAGAHLLALINEVLDLAKIESGHIELSMEPVEICHLITECLNLVHGLASKRGIKLSHKGLEGLTVHADHIRLKQALLNLISNAIKYNREGGSVFIEVLTVHPDRLRIMVKDTGLGITPEHLAELFQPFNRLDAENSGIEGTGIGLTITRRIVEMMGGSVGVESEPGRGSTFWIELTIESSSDAAPAHMEEWTANPAVREDRTKQLILYIEDNPTNLKLVTQILERQAHLKLLTADRPEQGIELALSKKPDLILLDINMPHLDGYQVMEILKSDDSLANIPVIAISAHAMERDFQRARAAGFSDYLTKPLDIDAFLETLERSLTRAESVLA